LIFVSNISVDSDDVRSSAGRLFQLAGGWQIEITRPVMGSCSWCPELTTDHSWHLPLTETSATHTWYTRQIRRRCCTWNEWMNILFADINVVWCQLSICIFV